MLDNPEKAYQLIETLKEAVPFEAHLTKDSIAFLKAREVPINPVSKQIVSKISYMGDEGGIICYLQSSNPDSPVIVSITHLRFFPKQPFYSKIFAYQKHRVKKLKKQGGDPNGLP